MLLHCVSRWNVYILQTNDTRTFQCQVDKYFLVPISFPVVHRLLAFIHIVAGLLHRQMLNSSASSPSQLPFPTLRRVVLIVVFLPVTWSSFAQAIC